jgi:predicted Zn finger-like uncharacterized protein
MIVTCPNCSTHFKVPEGALGTKGRNMKCARCSHVWRAMAQPMVDEVPLESPPAKTKRGLPLDDVTARMFADQEAAGDIALAEIESLGLSGEGEERLQEEEDPFAEMSDLMRARRPESMPDMYEARVPKPARRKGGIILWIVFLFILLAAIAFGLYYLQDRIIDRFPGLAKYYDMAGVRQEDVGVGLNFRNYNSERLVQDNNEVLIVRGVIANTTGQKKDIPLLRLALYNGANLLQEKVVAPPQPTLDAKATVGFKVTLEQPHPDATRFEVTFTAPKPAGAQ